MQRARQAGKPWRLAPPAARWAALERLRAALTNNAEAVARTISREIGKPVQESYGAEILPSLATLDFLLKRGPRLLRARAIPGTKAVLRAEPFGVIGIIGTWNYPLFLNLSPICSALAAGNTVVWKPSELATDTARCLEALFTEAQFPPDVVTTLYGDGATGRALTQAGCDKYIFTGGFETGRAILTELAKQGKPAVMELSGNDAFLVCADAPLDLAAESAVWGRVSNAGQSCVAPQRFYVAREVYPAFLDRVQSRLARLSRDEITPLRTPQMRLRCHQLVQEAVDSGARLLSGGYLPRDEPDDFYPPTLLADCTDEMKVIRDDFFGPALAVCPVESEAEAIERANASEMALGASVWTRNRRRGEAIAARLRAGVVSINDVLTDAANPLLPFGGRQNSGFGKQRGEFGLEEFIFWKVIVTHAPGGTRRHLFPYLPATEGILYALTQWRGQRGLARLGAIKMLAQAIRDWQRETKR